MTYREAESLKRLKSEIDRAAPRRSTASDGWIGDAAHASRTSDHNPWLKDASGVGVVRARDFTHDPAGGLDCHKLALFLADALGGHPALRAGAYIIWNRRIISAKRLSEGWRPYTGSNPHTKHLHLSASTTAGEAGYDSTLTWGWPPKAPKVARNTELRIDEISSRWDRPVASLKADIDRSSAAADVILLTEVYDRRAALARIVPAGWTLHQVTGSDLAEVAILTRDAEWVALHYSANVVGPDPGPGNRVVCGLAVLEHTNGHRFMVSISHMPSGVESNWAGKRARIYRRAVKGIEKLHTDRFFTYAPNAEAAFADWNLNAHRRWVRAYFKSAVRRMTFPRAAIVPKGGTHAGGRLIDFFLRRGWRVNRWVILPATDGSDHRAIRVHGQIGDAK
ncbi:hypothetical protein [Nocardioides sp.]|uniref:hypothetical protein n=1 Tax=Nocardioides sp. TaxID=35761 RepID=UPI002CEFB165|nr:hypothetical protein [Nocardioides sp.]HSX68117.1 hypothetical protein [Nocardioides sp.]